jgi:hypothetical protein
MKHVEYYNAMIKRGIIPCFSIDNEGEYYFEPTEHGFLVGTMCNCGLLKKFEYEYDNDFSFDENLQEMYEQLIERICNDSDN